MAPSESLEMAVPTQAELHRPILEIGAESRQSLTQKEVVARLTTRFSLTEDDLQEMVPSGGQTRVANKTAWATSYLKRAGLLIYPEPKHLQITHQGLEFLANHQGPIRSRDLRQLIEDASRGSDGDKTAETLSADLEDISPDEQMAKIYQLQQDQLADDILDSMKNISPAGFERLVVRLLEMMGYGGGKPVGVSGDRGIDGILNQDTLGLEKIYVQAKRYDNATVGEPEIRNFAGSLDGQGATKGVFITTATFAQRARQTAENISMGNKSIILIDGRQLAQLMIRHGVGVVTEITYEIKTLDANYFAEV